MKITISINEENEDEVIIKCREYTKEVENLKQTLVDKYQKSYNILVSDQNRSIYLDISKILFFQTEGKDVICHTAKNDYLVKQKLYELADILPSSFMRVSKSCILNLDEVYSVTKNITSFSVVEFRNSHKKISVSRGFYSSFKTILDERRRIL